MRKTLCPNCKLEAHNTCICCDRCNKWYHYKCTTLTEFEIQLHEKNEYKPWRCSLCIDKYCIKCNKTFPESNINSICCDKCSYWFHQNCALLTTCELDYYTVNTEKSWFCKSCIDKNCKKCNTTLYRKQSIKCNLCKNKYHIKCVGITKMAFTKTCDNLWSCEDCLSNIFPFHQLDNDNIEDLHDKKVKKHALSTINIENYKNWCTVCDKKVFRPLKGLPCVNCNNIYYTLFTKNAVSSTKKI